MTMRLSNSSFTGTARTDVAVGSSSEAFMFLATAAAGPRRVTSSGPSGAESASLAGAAALACGLAAGLAGAAAGFAAGAAGAAGAAEAAAAGCAAGFAGAAGWGAAFGWAGAAACACGAGGGLGGAGGVRGRGAGRGLRGGRSGLVVGEEVPPGSIHGVRVLEVLLIDLVDEPLVGTEGGRGVLARVARLVGVGRDARVTGGLWRHGENRPLPLHKMVDSGNQGYASPTRKVRPGPFIVA